MNAAFLFGLPGKIKTLLDRLTATRAGLLDNLNATISSRAAASTALSNSIWTNTKAGYLDAPISSIPSAFVKSVQRGTATYGAGENSISITVSAVNMAKSMLLINEKRTTPWGLDEYVSGGYLVTSTAILISRPSTSNSNGNTVYWQLVEYY